MGKPLSMDFRTRVISAVDEGFNRRKSAARFGVAPSTAIRWDTARRFTGTFAPKPQGGGTRSRRIEAHAGLIHAALEDPPRHDAFRVV
jgi:transposase